RLLATRFAVPNASRERDGADNGGGDRAKHRASGVGRSVHHVRRRIIVRCAANGFKVFHRLFASVDGGKDWINHHSLRVEETVSSCWGHVGDSRAEQTWQSIIWTRHRGRCTDIFPESWHPR